LQPQGFVNVRDVRDTEVHHRFAVDESCLAIQAYDGRIRLAIPALHMPADHGSFITENPIVRIEDGGRNFVLHVFP
jgi:hypothetical protein